MNNSKCNWFCFWNKKFDKDIFYPVCNTIFSIVTNFSSDLTESNGALANGALTLVSLQAVCYFLFYCFIQ